MMQLHARLQITKVQERDFKKRKERNPFVKTWTNSRYLKTRGLNKEKPLGERAPPGDFRVTLQKNNKITSVDNKKEDKLTAGNIKKVKVQITETFFSKPSFCEKL